MHVWPCMNLGKGLEQKTHMVVGSTILHVKHIRESRNGVEQLVQTVIRHVIQRQVFLTLFLHVGQMDIIATIFLTAIAVLITGLGCCYIGHRLLREKKSELTEGLYDGSL